MKKTILNQLALGFTLIELLVVISIIGVLVAVASANFITAQKQARDTRRMQDMEGTLTSLEAYFAEKQEYPVTTAEIDSAFDSGIRPVDPKSGSYNWMTAQYSYCICSTMETKTGNATGGTSAGCTWSTTGTLFCIQNKQ